MKKLLLFAFTIFAFSFVSEAQNPTEKEQIQQKIQLYFDGWDEGDTTKIGKAMHTTCHLKFFRDNKFTDMTRADYLGRFKPKTKDKSLKSSILSLDITENIAAAKTEINNEKAIYIDYFNLIKTNEGWFIVDKISVRKDKK